MHTIDEGLPLAGNMELVEIDIDLFNDMSREKFMDQAYDAANRFWLQMQKGQIHKNTKIKFKRKLTLDDIGNE